MLGDQNFHQTQAYQWTQHS